MPIPDNLMVRAWRAYEAHAVVRGIEPSEYDFVTGFSVAVGIMAGTMDIGLSPDTKSRDLVDKLLTETANFRARLPELERQALDRTRRMNKLMG